MKTFGRGRIAGIVCSAAVLPFVAIQSAHAQLTFDQTTGTGYANANFSFALGIPVNDNGVAVGYADKYVGGTFLGNRGVRWDSFGNALELGNLGTDGAGFTFSQAYSINTAGQTAGFAQKYVGGNFQGERAVYWETDGSVVDLNTRISPSSNYTLTFARAISDTGWVAGIGLFDPDGTGPLTSYQRHFLLNISTRDRWRSAFGGVWQTGSNWTNNFAPGSVVDAVFDLGSFGYTVSVLADETARDLVISNDNPTLSIAAGKTLSATGNLLVGDAAGSGRLQLSGSGTLSVAGTTTVTGTLILSGGNLDVAQTIQNNGQLFARGSISGTGALENAGQTYVSGGNLIYSSSGSFTNSGGIWLESGRQLQLTSGDLLNDGTISINGGTLAASGGANIVNGSIGVISGNGRITGSFSNAGTIELASGTLQVPSFTNNGTIAVSGAAANLASNLTTDTITNAATLEGRGRVSAKVVNTGTIEAVGGTLTFSAPLANSASGLVAAGSGNKVLLSSGFSGANAGTVNLAGGTLDTNNVAVANSGSISGFGTIRTGGINNTGQMQLTAGVSQIIGNVTTAPGNGPGQLTITGGATVTFFDDLRNESTTNAIKVSKQGSVTSSLVVFGTFSGNTSTTGGGAVFVEGTFSPGFSPTQAVMEGDLTLGGAATTILEIGGTSPGAQYDQLLVGGTASLGGTIDLQLINGFDPTPGSTFDVLVAGQILDQSVTFNGLLMVDGEQFIPSLISGDSGDVLRLTVAGLPEPAAGASVLLVGLAALARRRSRDH